MIDERDFRLEQVAEGAWAAIAESQFAVGNAGIVDLGGETLVFDTSWTPFAARTLGPGQERLAGLQQELETSDDAPGELVAAVAVIEQRLPDDLFDERRSLGRAELLTYGGGHTASDAFLHLADAGVLFAADLVLVRSHGWIGDGVPDAWPGIVDRIGELDFDVLVPGHGEVGGRGDLEAFRAYLDDLLTAGPDTPVPERYRDWAYADGWSRNLTALLARESGAASR